MKKVILALLSLTCLIVGTVVFADSSAAPPSGIGAVAHALTTNLGAVARLITAAAYVAGMAFAVGAIVKFKAHKDNPTQIPIGTPIALLFVGAALIFMPSIFKVAGFTLFGGVGGGPSVAGVSGLASFGAAKGGN